MQYCGHCILPDTRPGLVIGADGVCSACRSHSTISPQIDWDARSRRFAAIVAEVRGIGRDWDCVIPVSGGKDSTWQVVTCLEHGLRPLAVTWRSPGRTPLGAANLQNLVELGVDHMDVTANPRVERRFMLASLKRYGTTAIPMHLAIFSIPTNVAARYEIPLIVWGENSALEYVGDVEHAGTFELTGEWVEKYGAVHGTTIEDWACEGLTSRETSIYARPSDEELRAKGVRAIFLGMFFEWDPQRTFDVARAHGFQASERPRTGFWDYADVDDDFISLHHWLKWHKFGFTRAWDNLAVEIRNGRITRNQAIETLRELGDQTPRDDIAAFCRYVRIDEQEFLSIVETFRNRDIWTERDGVWRIDGFLIPDWPWS
jgi:N-acetyl sugar amidotransferase